MGREQPVKLKGSPPSSASSRPHARMEAYWNIAAEDLYSGGWGREPPQQIPSEYYGTTSSKYSNIGRHNSVSRYEDTCSNCSYEVCSDYARRACFGGDINSHRYGTPDYIRKGLHPCNGPPNRCITTLTPDYYESLSDQDEKDYEEAEEDERTNSLQTSSFSITKAISFRKAETSSSLQRDSNKKPGSKLKRRQAYYRERKQGRSRSLTHIDRLDGSGGLMDKDDVDSTSEPRTSNEQLTLPIPSEAEARHQRRKKLTGSQVCSSEYFSVQFEDELGCRYEEFLPATRGISLGEALRPLLERQHLALGKVDIFVEASSKTPLPSPSATDTYFVAGKNLIIRPKVHKPDSKFHCRSFKDPTRKRSQRNKGVFFGGSAEDAGSMASSPVAAHPNDVLCPSSPHTLNWNQPSRLASSATASHEGSLKVKQSKQSNRWSGLFSNSAKDNSKMDLLAEQLNGYSLHGIPGATLPEEKADEGKYVLEEDVRSIVIGWDDLTERGQKQQTAIWELVETEVVYLKTVKVITDLFLVCLYNLQTKNILNEIDREELFSNIPEIYAANRSLWLQSLHPMVEKARRTKEPLMPSELRNGFLEFGGTCSPYIRYCLDQTKCQRYCREKYHENELFKAYLAWCETRKECNRLRLMDILVRPMQRMTKYSLLLKAILKHTESPSERTDLEDMIQSVETFVLSVNGALRNRQEAERLKGISDRIEAYDAVETREEELEGLVKSHSNLDLFHPMPGCGVAGRAFLFEGDLKVKDVITKFDAHCFLFTDMLLICKATGRKGEKVKVVRPPLVVDRLLVKELSRDPGAFGLVYLNEYGTAAAALTLHASDSKVVRTWLDNIKKAQKLYTEAKRKESSDFVGDGLEEADGWNTNYLTSRSPRECSSYASQLSSLIHSHSGSIEINEASSLPSRGVSFEHEHRASSFSSDDATGGVSGESLKGRSPNTESGPTRTSPRAERRTFLSKSPTPNRLSVKVPTASLSGQSLPNLSSASESLPQTYSIHSLVVPKGFLSPTHRGVSYPPPSPRNLTRSEALTSARNPPLIKSRNISSTEVSKTCSLDIQVPNVKGVHAGHESTPKGPLTAAEGPSQSSESIRIQHHKPEHISEEDLNCVGVVQAKRLARSERSDMKRYYTAGAIEDIKKEVLKDSSIHKRLSWNCGPQHCDTGDSRPLSTVEHARNQQFVSIESMASVRSSSGVSSTTSLFLSGVSDMDKGHEAGHGVHRGRTSPGDVSINVCQASLDIGPCQPELPPQRAQEALQQSPDSDRGSDGAASGEKICSGLPSVVKSDSLLESSHL